MTVIEPVDVLVVGGGPAGAACALEARRQGAKNVLLIDKAKAGRLKSCAGGISPRAEKNLRSMGLWDGLEPDLYPISGARIVFREWAMVFAGEQTASVRHRADLDRYLLEAAQDAGATIRFETKAAAPLMEAGRCVGVRLTEDPSIAGDPVSPERRSSIAVNRQDTPDQIRAAVTVFAGGAGSSLARDPRPRKSLTSCTSWYTGVSFPEGRMDMIFPKSISPHYLWLFPEADNRANIGMCLFPDRLGGRKIVDLFDELVEHYLTDRLEGARRIAGPLVHPIRPARRFVNRAPTGSLVCGEEAGLVNGFTGEGISLALESGREAGRCAARIAAMDPDRQDQWIQRYEKNLRGSTNGALRTGRFLCAVGPGLLRITAAFASNRYIASLMTGLLSKA